MEIIKIIIDDKFPSEIKKQAEEQNKNIEFSPIWQSIEWNIMLQNTAYIEKWIFVWIFDSFELVNFVIIEKRSIWFKKYWNFIIWWPNNNKYIEELELEIINIWKEEDVIFTQIESLNEIELKIFKSWVFKKFIEKCTAIINLSEWKDIILSKMKQKWRYNIKIAEKNNVIVSRVENSSENIENFYNLLTETKERDSFNVNSKAYFEKLLKYLYENNLWALYLASKDNELIAWWIFVNYLNTTYYYYWASTSDNEKRKYMATYLLQWKVIEDSIEKGMQNFDFLWITCPWDKSTKLAWVTDFKLKLTSEIKIWPSPNIFVHKNLIYLLFKLKIAIKGIIKK